MLFRSPDDLGFDPNQVTPGWVGFTATAVVAGVIILLLFDFFRRVSRINDRADARERLEAELEAAEREAAERDAEARAAGEASEDADRGGAPAPVEPLEADRDRPGAAG
jgi:hypothetical protein